MIYFMSESKYPADVERNVSSRAVLKYFKNKLKINHWK